MTTKIKVIFGDDPQRDGSYDYRLRERLPLLEKVMQRSAKPFEVRNANLYDDVGGIAGGMWIFYVDEFYTGIVMDLINNLSWDGFGWFSWFKNKYKVA